MTGSCWTTSCSTFCNTLAHDLFQGSSDASLCKVLRDLWHARRCSDALSLHAQPYTWRYPSLCCGTNPSHIDIPYAALADYLDPDGPYRHVVGTARLAKA